MTILKGNNHSEGPTHEKQRDQEDCNRRGERKWLTGGDTPQDSLRQGILGAARAA